VLFGWREYFQTALVRLVDSSVDLRSLRDSASGDSSVNGCTLDIVSYGASYPLLDIIVWSDAHPVEVLSHWSMITSTSGGTFYAIMLKGWLDRLSGTAAAVTSAVAAIGSYTCSWACNMRVGRVG
jgi:hypothetical protein